MFLLYFMAQIVKIKYYDMLHKFRVVDPTL